MGVSTYRCLGIVPRFLLIRHERKTIKRGKKGIPEGALLAWEISACATIQKKSATSINHITTWPTREKR